MDYWPASLDPPDLLRGSSTPSWGSLLISSQHTRSKTDSSRQLWSSRPAASRSLHHWATELSNSSSQSRTQNATKRPPNYWGTRHSSLQSASCSDRLIKRWTGRPLRYKRAISLRLTLKPRVETRDKEESESNPKCRTHYSAVGWLCKTSNVAKRASRRITIWEDQTSLPEMWIEFQSTTKVVSTLQRYNEQILRSNCRFDLWWAKVDQVLRKRATLPKSLHGMQLPH